MNKQTITTALIIILILFGGIFLLFASMNGFFTPLIERIKNEKPEIKIATYLEATTKNNKAEALAMWELPQYEAWKESKESPLLKERRESVTENLIKNKIKNFDILEIEWWGTCCEPRVIESPRGAGGARVRVQLVGDEYNKYIYIFDVFNQKTTYWGAAQGYPVRHWVLRDVYLPTQEPLFWKRP